MFGFCEGLINIFVLEFGIFFSGGFSGGVFYKFGLFDECECGWVKCEINCVFMVFLCDVIVLFGGSGCDVFYLFFVEVKVYVLWFECIRLCVCVW